MNDERSLRARTKMFARRIIRFFFVFTENDAAAQTPGKQALGAGTSIGANYREAWRARSKAEFISKVGDCLKEAEETLYWLELLTDEGIVSLKKIRPLLEKTKKIIQLLRP